MLRLAFCVSVPVGIDIAYFLFLFVSLSLYWERRIGGGLKGSFFFF